MKYGKYRSTGEKLLIHLLLAAVADRIASPRIRELKDIRDDESVTCVHININLIIDTV